MDKNILIIGSARSGKTTLAKKFVKEKGYSMISFDNKIKRIYFYIFFSLFLNTTLLFNV